ncbi:hypothetical protein LBMAG21_08010 [Armatimonadota bacterium]|nr:hypothetical protein LBMAG21_08010 [Armatimonadota bacterium]
MNFCEAETTGAVPCLFALHKRFWFLMRLIFQAKRIDFAEEFE